INMVEGSTNELTEAELIDALFVGHDAVKKQVAWQLEIQKEIGKPKQTIDEFADWTAWTDRIQNFLTPAMIKSAFVTDKVERNKALDEIRTTFNEKYADQIEEQEVSSKIIDYIVDSVIKEKISDIIIAQGKRIDGRDFNQVREVSTEVGLLP